MKAQRRKKEAIMEAIKKDVFNMLSSKCVSANAIAENVFKLCTTSPVQYSEYLYDEMKIYLKFHVKGLKKELLMNDDNILPLYLEKWRSYSSGAYSMVTTFRYLNTTWIADQRAEHFKYRNGGVHTVKKRVYEMQDLALMAWKKHLFEVIKNQLNKEILSHIKMERDYKCNESELISIAMQSYVSLSTNPRNGSVEPFIEQFIEKFLKETSTYYAQESDKFIKDHAISAYLKKAETRIQEEESRGQRYMSSDTSRRLMDTCYKVLIENHKDLMIEQCHSMLKNMEVDDLRRMFNLLSRVPNCLDPMIECVSKFVVSWSLDEVDKKTKAESTVTPTCYVECLLTIVQKFNNLIEEAFCNHTIFLDTMDKSYRQILNENTIAKDPNRSSELFSKYFDQLLKKGNKNYSTENELEKRISDVISIFKYLDDKDIFQKHYSKLLARRLIFGASVSDESERSMIEKLKKVCGYEYTSKFQRMFNDIQSSYTTQAKFKQWLKENDLLMSMELSMLIITSGSWPIQPAPSNFNVPQELEIAMNYFIKFYGERFDGKKLHWIHSMSRADVRILYLKKKYECQVTNFQLSILLMFNSMQRCTFNEILKITGLCEADVKRNLDSLIDSGLLLLDSNVYILNEQYENKRSRFKVTFSAPENTQQIQQAKKSLEEDRKFFLQAVIVRIMKQRKQLGHNMLIQEVIEQSKTRFVPNVPMIKKSIDHLIEKEYMERYDENSYQYLS